MHEDVKVLDVIPGDVVTLKTNKGDYHTKSVVLAPGPWATDLLKRLNLDLPIKVNDQAELWCIKLY